MKKYFSRRMKKCVSRTLSLVLVVTSIVTSSMVPTASAAGTLQLPDLDEQHCIRGYIIGVTDMANKRLQVYRNQELTEYGSEWVGITDEVKVLDYDEEHHSVLLEYPLDQGGVKRRWAPIQGLIGTATSSTKVVAKQQVRAYINTTRTRAYGTIYKGDVVYVLDYHANGCVRVIYPLDAGGYKIAFVSEADLERLTAQPAAQQSPATVTAAQANMVRAAASYMGSPNFTGYCQRFVRVVGQEIGLPSGNAASALDACAKWRVSTSMDNIPVGAVVYLRSKTPGTAGYRYGHVGVYTGNGEVIHAQSTVRKDSLSTLLASYTYMGWGWQSGVDLTSK